MTAWHCAFLEEADSGAAYRMAVEYIDAKVVEYDSARALELLTASAVRGEARAQFELGAIYEDGTLDETDPVRAMLWYMAAAQQGHAAAEYSLGRIHETGSAAGSDKLLAYSYYELADRHGFPLVAKEAKERLGVELSDRDMEVALVTARRLELSQGNNPPLR
jgi:TPR repeat protein